MTYKQWYQEYLRLYKRKLAEKTQESYTRLNALISPIIGTKELEAITPDDIQTAIISAEETAGCRQAQLVYTLLHAAFRRAVRSGHIRQSPVEAVDKPDHEGKQGRAIEGADWQLLAPIIRESVAFSLACFAGLRRGEVLGLRRGDIDLEAGLIRIERQRVRVRGQLVTAPPKSSAGVRIVPISPELAPILTKAVRYLLPAALSRPNLARNTRTTMEHGTKGSGHQSAVSLPRSSAHIRDPARAGGYQSTGSSVRHRPCRLSADRLHIHPYWRSSGKNRAF